MIKDIHDLLRLLIHLTIYESSSIEDIAKHENLDIDDTKRLTDLLLEHQLIQNNQNRYQLIKPAKDYVISEVIQELFQTFTNVKCLKDDQACSEFESCTLNCFWHGLEKVFFEYADEYTLEDLKNGYCLS